MQLQANKILIVDDSANFRKILSTFLSKIFKDVQIDQHDPAASPDLNTAIDWGKYDLVLLDYNLGQEKTGLDWYQALKSIDNFPVTVMLTGEGSEQLAVKALKNGVDDYISKENLTKSRLTETIYEASQIHHEKLQKRLSFTQQGKAFNTELFYSALESSLKSQSNESRLYILKCKLVNQAEETDGIIFRDNLNRFVAKKVFYFLLSMEIKVKIISIQDKYIALFIENDSHDINYLPEIICKDMKKTTFTSGNVNCDFFIHVGVVPMNLNIIDASRVIDTGIVLTDSIDADKSTYSIYEESDEKIEPAAETKPDDSNFSVITAIKDNRLRPLYQPMVVVADIPNMSDCDTYDVRSRFISSSGVQLLEEEFAQLMEVDKNTRLIDNWLMRHTLGHLLEKRKGADDKLKFCVKLTHQSLSDPDFLQWLIKLLKEQTIPKNSFFLDIPIEDMLKSTKKYFQRLKEH